MAGETLAGGIEEGTSRLGLAAHDDLDGLPSRHFEAEGVDVVAPAVVEVTGGMASEVAGADQAVGVIVSVRRGALAAQILEPGPDRIAGGGPGEHLLGFEVELIVGLALSVRPASDGCWRCCEDFLGFEVELIVGLALSIAVGR